MSHLQQLGVHESRAALALEARGGACAARAQWAWASQWCVRHAVRLCTLIVGLCMFFVTKQHAVASPQRGKYARNAKTLCAGVSALARGAATAAGARAQHVEQEGVAPELEHGDARRQRAALQHQRTHVPVWGWLGSEHAWLSLACSSSAALRAHASRSAVRHALARPQSCFRVFVTLAFAARAWRARPSISVGRPERAAGAGCH